MFGTGATAHASLASRLNCLRRCDCCAILVPACVESNNRTFGRRTDNQVKSTPGTSARHVHHTPLRKMTAYFRRPLRLFPQKNHLPLAALVFFVTCLISFFGLLVVLMTSVGFAYGLPLFYLKRERMLHP